MALDPRDTPCRVEGGSPWGFHDFRLPRVLTSKWRVFWSVGAVLARDFDPCEMWCLHCGRRWYA